MERRLYRAALEGNVPSLLQLLREDELVLERSLVGPHSDTPLHVAAMLGHSEFVSKILSLKPELACELDSQRSTPLHLAAAKGYVDIVKGLLNACKEACLVSDKYGRNPLQVAAVKGKVEVLEVLVQVEAEAARIVNKSGETVLHTCVKNNKLESLKVLVGMFGGEDEFIDWKDKDGNSALHLAAADGQFETVDFLTTHTRADIHSRNLEGFMALDLLAQSTTGTKEKAIADNQSMSKETRISPSSRASKFPSGAYNWKKHFKRQNSWLERMRNSLMVVATLTATMAFQAGMNPPGGVWQDNAGDNSTSVPVNSTISFFGLDVPGNSTITHLAGITVMGDSYYGVYLTFLVCNTISFIASLSIILLLISGLPMRRRLFVGVLMVIMWIVITSMALTYAISVIFLTPRGRDWSYWVIWVGILAWMGLMTLLFVLHIIRLIVKASHACIKAVTHRRRRIMV
ncbi:ankyrin repeat-containing protein BDA1-like [Punica granatum]|uniref:Ankyrin repeat-containing protein BDA1-like n=2 Tax=Punica granatum TaxID=22663 RepID=A0A218VSK9_PUNGR|nr:ankyrin repeat-containing protein BDA1-like [Punica granatum]OWM63346.1 hypothetical protein CDL15_Pgr022091 [Punica granatum]